MERLTVHVLIAQLRIEALIITVLPWAARSNGQRLNTQPRQPCCDRLGRELGAVIRVDKEQQVCFKSSFYTI